MTSVDTFTVQYCYVCTHCLPELHHMGGPCLLSCRGKTVQESRAHNAQIAAEEQAYRNEQRFVLFSSCCHHGSCKQIWSHYNSSSFTCTGPGAQQQPANMRRASHKKTPQHSKNSSACAVHSFCSSLKLHVLSQHAGTFCAINGSRCVLSASSASAGVTCSNSHFIHSVALQECKVSKPGIKGG